MDDTLPSSSNFLLRTTPHQQREYIIDLLTLIILFSHSKCLTGICQPNFWNRDALLWHVEEYEHWPVCYDCDRDFVDFNALRMVSLFYFRFIES